MNGSSDDTIFFLINILDLILYIVTSIKPCRGVGEYTTQDASLVTWEYTSSLFNTRTN